MNEIPKGRYTGERTLKILLNPNIKRRRGCYKQPINVSTSSTFVVDLSLEHPDDIKKVEFGKWKYSGSHSVSYTAWDTGKGLQFERIYSCCSEPENVFQLRRIHCKLYTNALCQQLFGFCYRYIFEGIFFIGPTMIHYRNTYLFFAATLICLRRELQGLCAFGTDEEKALGDAFA